MQERGIKNSQENILGKTWLTPEWLNKPLETLREHEWQWLDPRKPRPTALIFHKLLDHLSLGAFSRSQLKNAFKFGLSDSPSHRFVWECAAIAIRPNFAEAYVRRAIDGHFIFKTMGGSMGGIERLQGWDLQGNELIYDTDCAINDATIALRLQPDWDWALYVQGWLLWNKARPRAPRGDVDWTWGKLAEDRIERSLTLSQSVQNSQNCKERLEEIRQAKT